MRVVEKGLTADDWVIENCLQIVPVARAMERGDDGQAPENAGGRFAFVLARQTARFESGGRFEGPSGPVEGRAMQGA